MRPFSPTQIVPDELSGLPSPRLCSGFLPPSYQVSVTGGSLSADHLTCRSGKSKRMISDAGPDSAVAPSAVASADVGAPSSSAQYAVSTTWHAMSPSAPEPKSHQARQSCGQ